MLGRRESEQARRRHRRTRRRPWGRRRVDDRCAGLQRHARTIGQRLGWPFRQRVGGGPDGSFGYTQRDTGSYGEDEDAPTRVVYEGFSSVDGDSQAAPSPSGRFVVLVNASSGSNKIIRARADGSGRTVLTNGSQPDWQPRP